MCDWIGCSLLAVTGRSLVVRATPSTLTDSLVAAAKRSGRLPITRGHFRFDEKAAVVICENDITGLHLDQPVWQKGVTIEAFVFDENAQVVVLREKRWCAIQGSNL